MDEDTAREVVKVTIRCSALLNELSAIAVARLPEADARRLKIGIGKALWEVSSEVGRLAYNEYPELEATEEGQWRSLGQLDEATWLGGRAHEEALADIRQRQSGEDQPAAAPKVSDPALDRLLLAQVAYPWRKVMRVIATVFQENLNYRCGNALLYGFGSDEPDILLDRCIDRLRALAAEGRIEIAGNVAEPRRSEVRQVVKPVAPHISGAPEFRLMDFSDSTLLISGTQASIYWLAHAFSSGRPFELPQAALQGQSCLSFTPTINETGTLTVQDGNVHWEISRQEAKRCAADLFQLARSDHAAHQYLDPERNEAGLQLIVSLGEYEIASPMAAK